MTLIVWFLLIFILLGCVGSVHRARHDQVNDPDGRAAPGPRADHQTDRRGQRHLRSLPRCILLFPWMTDTLTFYSNSYDLCCIYIYLTIVIVIHIWFNLHFCLCVTCFINQHYHAGLLVAPMAMLDRLASRHRRRHRPSLSRQRRPVCRLRAL